MVLRILTTLLITSLWCGAEDYQIANKASAGLQIVTASMPFNMWTNSTLWLVGAAPVQNVGTTNAEWICFAKTCSTMAQPTLNSQPTMVFTNGVWGASFDGVDDFVRAGDPINYIHQTGKFRVNVRVFIRDVTKSQRVLLSQAGAVSGKFGVLIDNVGSSMRLFVLDGGTNANVSVTRPSANGWNTYSAVGNGTNVVLTVNGSSVTGTYLRAMSNTNSSQFFTGIGGISSAAPLDGLIDYIYVTENP